MKQYTTVFCLVFALTFSLQAQKKIRYVKQNAQGDGSSWEKASGSIQQMLDASVAGDQIWVVKGEYFVLNNDGNGLMMKEGVNAYGGFLGTEQKYDEKEMDCSKNITILRGNNSRILTQEQIYKTPTRWVGFTMRDGDASHANYKKMRGGAAYLQENGELLNCIIENNVANSSTINANTSVVSGGGVYNDGTLSSCIIKSNIANSGDLNAYVYVYGGGVYNSDFGTINNCIITDNVANTGKGHCANYGGGISNSGWLFNSLIAGNASSAGSGNGYGGGVANIGSGEIGNCTVTGNIGVISSDAAGIRDVNESIGIGGGVYIAGGVAVNNIIWENQSMEGYINDVKRTSGTITYSLFMEAEEETKNNNLKKNPLFVDPHNRDFHLQTQSPCKDRGSNKGIFNADTAKDLDGKARVNGGFVDMGAYEL